MTVASPSSGVMNDVESASKNPALNDKNFARAKSEAGAAGGAMTARGAYLKTLILLLVLMASGAFGWSQVEIVQIGARQVALQPAWTWIAILATLILAFMGIFAPRAIPVIAILYAMAQGALLGISSRYFSLEWDGIVTQAILATVFVFAGTLLLYLTNVIKVTSKFVMGVSIAMAGLLLLYLTTWLLSLFGVNFGFLYNPTPLGIAFAVFVVILAALNLPVDFEFIRRASAAGAPKVMEWYGAFGLMVSIIWMYVSILRLLALLRSRN
jgi:uncharacterized YccA/Bax inhibitor family protein